MERERLITRKTRWISNICKASRMKWLKSILEIQNCAERSEEATEMWV